MSIKFVLAMAALLLASTAARSDEVTEGRELERQATAANGAGDYAAAADLMAKALALRPNHPGVTYRLAKASVRAGRMDAAIDALDNYAAMGMKADIAADPLLAPLANNARMAAVMAALRINAEPKGHLTIEATIGEPQILAEGIAFDPTSQRLYVGSVHKRKIIALETHAVERDFVPSASQGLLGVFGMTLDPSGKSLWAATSAVPQAGGGITPIDKSRAGIVEFSTVDGGLKKKTVLPDDGKEHVIGDLTRTRRGEIFASDSIAPNLYRLTADGSALETFVTSDRFHSLQGLALSADGRRLAVADYSGGILVVDIASRAVTLLAMPAHTTLHGIDALVRHGRDLIAIQNGVDPQRVVRLRMNQGWTSVEGLDVLAANLAEMSEPTLATIAGDDLLIIGNGQWERFADDGSIKG
ncbi:MAG: tetratricopeptide repeat protein, partial [Micropepsaceae bacterium]